MLSSRQPIPLRRGLSQMEVMASSLMVALVIVASLRSVGGITRGRQGVGDDIRAQQLAQQLLTEILLEDYQEPDDTPVFGSEGAEPNATTGPRSSWDDVDDYHLWTSSPPEDRTGTSLTDFTGWERSVSVVWVDPTDPATISLSDQGVKRVTVTVKLNGVILAEQTGLRTDKYNLP